MTYLFFCRFRATELHCIYLSRRPLTQDRWQHFLNFCFTEYCALGFLVILKIAAKQCKWFLPPLYSYWATHIACEAWLSVCAIHVVSHGYLDQLGLIVVFCSNLLVTCKMFLRFCFDSQQNIVLARREVIVSGKFCFLIVFCKELTVYPTRSRVHRENSNWSVRGVDMVFPSKQVFIASVRCVLCISEHGRLI